jgi:hypothetical protein
MFATLFYRFISDQAKMLIQRAFQISALADENSLRSWDLIFASQLFH